MTFSVIVAWIALIITSVLFVLIAFDEFTKTKARRDLEELAAKLGGYKRSYLNPRFVGLVLVWVVAGVYLFG